VKILIVEDDDKIASFLTKGLGEEGFSTDRTADGMSACGARPHRSRLIRSWSIMVGKAAASLLPLMHSSAVVAMT
jgi:CheY-like chemotaxis protein